MMIPIYLEWPQKDEFDFVVDTPSLEASRKGIIALCSTLNLIITLKHAERVRIVSVISSESYEGREETVRLTLKFLQNITQSGYINKLDKFSIFLMNQ